MIFTILERDDVSVCRFPKDLQDFARKHPIVSVQNSRPRFDDNSSHRGMKVQRSTRLRNPTAQRALNLHGATNADEGQNIPNRAARASLNWSGKLTRTDKFLGFRRCFIQALGMHLEYCKLGIFEYVRDY